MRHFLPAVMLLLVAPELAAFDTYSPAGAREAWNQPAPDWWEGPVRYALTDPETTEYRSLATAAERAAFIARFWAARDPSPFTSRNEGEEIFWQRVSSAEELFSETTISGWRTDRGRVYIVLGPPDEITSYPVPSVEELDPTHFPDPYQRWPQGELRPGHRGAAEWVYRSLKSAHAVAGQKFTFTRDETGQYRFSGRLATSFRYEPPMGNLAMYTRGHTMPGAGTGSTHGNVFTRDNAITQHGPTREDPNAERKAMVRAVDAAQADMASLDSTFGQAAILERFEEPDTLAGRVNTSEFFGAIPVQNRIDFFQGADGTSALITLGVAADDVQESAESVPQVEIFGQLQRIGDSSRKYGFSSTRKTGESVPLQEVGDRNHRLYQVRGMVLPGEYEVNLGVRVGDRFGAVVDRVVVPDFGGETLRLAGPILAEKIGESSATDGTKGFVLGQLRMLPKLEPVFRTGQDLGFYFQSYHALPDPKDGRLHLDIDYSVSVRQKGLYVSQGKPVSLNDNSAPTHAFLFPLTGWSAGEYLLTVTVTDRVTGKAVAGSTPFLVQ